MTVLEIPTRVMGVEFFAKGKTLTVNEMAPRVHNTGHYSLDTEGPSQFDFHWMCLFGEKLPKNPTTSSGFAMVNLLGGTKKKAILQATPGLHWYGKKEVRKGRKMGHVNATANSPKTALDKALINTQRISL